LQSPASGASWSSTSSVALDYAVSYVLALHPGT